jgi:DHA2 family multidrug resistance protein
VSAALTSSAASDGHRVIVVAALMTAFMQAVSISLPNAALLYIQGSLSMADDEVGWIFTSYIAASVITAPTARWLAGRFGRKVIFQLSIAIFTVGLVLAAHAETSLQFIAARVIQGGAAGLLGPLSMAILLDTSPPARQAHMSLVWTVTVLLGLLSGPSIGGWLSEYHGWSSLFYISLPIAAVVFLAMELTLQEKKVEQKVPFDFFGLATLSLGVIGLQLLLDRGERMEWFDSAEIWAEAIISSTRRYSRIATSYSQRSCTSPSASSCCQPSP